MLNTSKPLKKHLKCTRTPKEKGCCGVKSVDFFENKKQGTIRSSKRKYQCMEGWDLDIKGVRLEGLTDEEIDNFSTEFRDGYVGYLVAGKKVFFEESWEVSENSREASGIRNPKLTQFPQLSDEELNNMEILDTITFECRIFNMYLKAGSKLFYDGKLVEGIDVRNISAKDWKTQNYPPEDEQDMYPMHFLEIHGFYMTDDYFILEDKVIYKDKVVAGINANEFKKAIGYEYNYNLYVKVGNIVIKDGEIIKDLKGDDIEDLSKNQYDKYIRRENALLYDGHIVEGIEIQDSKDFELIEPAERFENYYARIGGKLLYARMVVEGFAAEEVNNCKSWGNRYLQIGDKLLYEGHLVKGVIGNKINHYKSLGGVYFQIDDKLLYDGRIVKGLTLNEIKNFKRIPGNGQYSAKAGHKYLQGGRVVTGRKTWQ